MARLLVFPTAHKTAVARPTGYKAAPGQPNIFDTADVPSHMSSLGQKFVRTDGLPYRFMAGSSTPRESARQLLKDREWAVHAIGWEVTWHRASDVTVRFVNADLAHEFAEIGQKAGSSTEIGTVPMLVATPEMEALNGTPAGTEVTTNQTDVLFAEHNDMFGEGDSGFDGVWWEPSFTPGKQTPARGIMLQRVEEASTVTDLHTGDNRDMVGHVDTFDTIWSDRYPFV